MEATARYGLSKPRISRSAFRVSVLVWSLFLLVGLARHTGAQWPCQDVACMGNCPDLATPRCVCPNNGCEQCPGKTCASNQACAPLGTCMAGVCVTQGCDPAHGDADCGSTGTCRAEDSGNGLCFKKCTQATQNTDCNAGSACTNGVWCTAKDCTADADCGGGGRTCMNGKCREASPCLTPADAATLQCALPDGDRFCPGAQWFSLALLPDVQSYNAKVDKATISDCQTEWLKANKDLHKGTPRHRQTRATMIGRPIVVRRL